MKYFISLVVILGGCLATHSGNPTQQKLASVAVIATISTPVQPLTEDSYHLPPVRGERF